MMKIKNVITRIKENLIVQMLVLILDLYHIIKAIIECF